MPYVPASIRYNNPGAQYPGPSARAFGSTGFGIIGGGHKIAQFPDPVSGAAAQFDLLTNGPYSKMPLGQAIRKWSGNNSSDAYIRSIADETGLDPSKPVTARELADPNVAIPLAKAMAKFESGRDFPLGDEDWQAAHSLAFGGGAPSAEPYASGSPAGIPMQQPYSGLLNPNEEPPATGSLGGNPVQGDTLPMGIPGAGGNTDTEFSAQSRMPARAQLTAGQTPPGASASPPTGNLPFGIPGTIGSNPIQQALGDNFSTLLAFAGGARQGGIGQGLTQASKAALVSDQQRSLDLQRAQDMAWKRFEANRTQGNLDRAYNLQVKTLEEGKLPTGYSRGPNGSLVRTTGGPADLAGIKAEAEAKRGPGLTDAATEVAARQLIEGDLSGLTNIGRGAQGDQKLTEIRNKAADILTSERGMSAGDAATHLGRQLQAFKASGIGQGQEARTTATREANLKLILKATDAAIPAALEASSAVARTGWVPLNKIIQRGQVITSSPELKEFGMANLQLAEHWARAMNPTGVMRESDRDLALGFLSTADSQPTYVRAVQQLKKQIDREYEAVRSGKPGEGPVLPSGASSTSGAAAPATARGAPPPPPGFKVQ